ncbi:MAG TPA: endolytic transglycosylase MltG [Bacteroidia bacterium]|nr:endolytic transglycosylase MltG [Bacteroidia bacterium]
MKKIFLIAGLVLLVLAGAGGYWFYRIYFEPNVHTPDHKPEFIYIHTGSDMQDLMLQLQENKIVDDTSSFAEIARLKKFSAPKPGRYRIRDGMSNRDLVNLLRSGEQEPVEVTFNNIRTKEQLAGRVGGKLEADSAHFLLLLNDPGFTAKFGLTTDNIMTMFIPNTYQFFWNTNEEQFIDRMAQEYKKFWTDDRKAKARAAGLSQSESIILASIVESEQSRFADELPVIAGLYINRLHKGIALQSDPTIIYALGDFSIQRVTNADLDINSPYNTYLHTGLPPGPIRIPESATVDAVLNYNHNNYLYMCAEFGTGRHRFTDDYNQHLKNAREYQAALNKANIRR